MQGLVTFETAPRPLFSGKSAFPYENVVSSLRVLDQTKSLVFNTAEVKYNNIQQIRKKIEALRLGELRVARNDGKVYIWLNTQGQGAKR